MDRESEFHQAYLKICDTISQLSRAERKKVGAIIVKDDSIISYGFNGTPKGLDNECEENGITKPETIHGEVNAIYKVANSHASCKDAFMYCNLEPCFDCAKSIIQSGIKCVIYSKCYGSGTGIELLRKSGIGVLHYENS